MENRAEIAKSLKAAGIIGIIRADSSEQIPLACQAVINGGIKAVEITLTTPKALELIKEISSRFRGKCLVGVGTVITSEQCEAAINAGAQFVVSPVGKLEVLKTAHRFNKPVMLGAYTPSEAQAAHEAGSDFIKIFPAEKLGPSYIKALRAPLPHLQIVPTGGVDLDTALDFLKAGCVALGAGSSLFPPAAMKASSWESMTQTASRFIAILEEFRGKQL